MSNLHYLCLCTYRGVQHISCCVFVLFLCPFLIAPSVFPNVYLNSDGMKSTNIKQSERCCRYKLCISVFLLCIYDPVFKDLYGYVILNHKLNR